MSFLIHLLSAFVCLAAIIYCCVLFSGAIEHLGEKLKLGNNAVGSILAVIGTSLPETIVPLVAIFGSSIINKSSHIGQNVAIGAIFGSPFMLSTVALFLLGITLIFKKRKEKALFVDCSNILRDFKYFLIAYTSAVLASFLPQQGLKITVVIFLLGLYGVFVYRTLVKSKQNFIQNELEELFICKILKIKKYELFFIILQLVLSISALAVFSHFFVCEIEYFSNFLNLSPIVLSLIITPFATELPECINSIIWLKNDKDDLAIANVAGAIVFQAMIPASIGILFTPWVLNYALIINALLLILCIINFIAAIYIYKKIKLFPLLFCIIFYVLYFIIIKFKTLL